MVFLGEFPASVIQEIVYLGLGTLVIYLLRLGIA
jgi:hypothetical protein